MVKFLLHLVGAMLYYVEDIYIRLSGCGDEFSRILRGRVFDIVLFGRALQGLV